MTALTVYMYIEGKHNLLPRVILLFIFSIYFFRCTCRSKENYQLLLWNHPPPPPKEKKSKIYEIILKQTEAVSMSGINLYSFLHHSYVGLRNITSCSALDPLQLPLCLLIWAGSWPRKREWSSLGLAAKDHWSNRAAPCVRHFSLSFLSLSTIIILFFFFPSSLLSTLFSSLSLPPLHLLFSLSLSLLNVYLTYFSSFAVTGTHLKRVAINPNYSQVL